LFHRSNPLYSWLECINIGYMFFNFVDSGYDDLESLIEQMRSPNPIHYDDLVSIGIKKPGHIYRVLVRLEEEAGYIFNRNSRRTRHTSEDREIGRFLKCCVTPSNATLGTNNSVSLRDWLASIKLEELARLFEAAGFEEYEFIISQMKSTYPITD
jgi:hypothetical protein